MLFVVCWLILCICCALRALFLLYRTRRRPAGPREPVYEGACSAIKGKGKTNTKIQKHHIDCSFVCLFVCLLLCLLVLYSKNSGRMSNNRHNASKEKQTPKKTQQTKANTSEQKLSGRQLIKTANNHNKTKNTTLHKNITKHKHIQNKYKIKRYIN